MTENISSPWSARNRWARTPNRSDRPSTSANAIKRIPGSTEASRRTSSSGATGPNCTEMV